MVNEEAHAMLPEIPAPLCRAVPPADFFQDRRVPSCELIQEPD